MIHVSDLIIQDVKALIAQFSEIYETVGRTKSSIKTDNSGLYLTLSYAAVFKCLVDEYQHAYVQFERVTSGTGAKTFLRDILYSKAAITLPYATEILVQLSIESKKAIAFLESISITKIPQEQLAKLEPLRKELKEMNIEVTYERNLTEALDELEVGHYLASSLISSRVIDRCMDAISGDTDDKKIAFLIEKKVVKNDEKDVKSSIIKAARLARNVLSHNLDIPTTKEAFSLLTDAFKLSEIVSKLQK